MTTRSDLWNLLLARKGEWVPREDMKFVGGESWDRRRREVEDDVARAGTYRLESKYEGNTITHMRVVDLPPDNPAAATRRMQWRCRGCGSPPQKYENTQASMDPRWRLGVCWVCDHRGKRLATYERAIR